jgi:NAD(P)-dependent dehydrogenase (short-subunit alcohol dehydrogenase family)
MTGDEVILITGTSSGFGRLLAEACARQGYTVYASMRQVTGRNAAAREELQALAATAGLSLHVLDSRHAHPQGAVHLPVSVLEPRAGAPGHQ